MYLTTNYPTTPTIHKVVKISLKSSRCPKLDGYAIANFGVRVEHEVVKMIHSGWSSGVVEWSSGVVEWSSRKVEWSRGVVE